MSKKRETPQQRRERLQRELGVLIPPSFVNGNRLPVTSQAALQASQAMTPSILDYLWITNPGTRLLEEYIHPGMSMSIPTSTQGGSILLHLKPPNLPSAAAFQSPFLQTSAILGTHHMDPFQLELLVPTAQHHPPSIQLSAKRRNFGVTARLAQQNNGTEDPALTGGATQEKDPGSWIEAKWKMQFRVGGGSNQNARNEAQPKEDTAGQTADFVASTWITKSSIQQLMGLGAKSRANADSKPPSIHLQAGVDYQQSVLAVQTEIPLTKELLAGDMANVSELPPIETLISIDLNHAAVNSNTTRSLSSTEEGMEEDDPSVSPPLWLTLKHSPVAIHTHKESFPWILNLSQVLTFDRIVVNPLEERAPNIRQTLGWVVQVEKASTNSSDKNIRPTESGTPSTCWSAGVTYQFNRSTAAKAVLLNGQMLRYGAIIKRWSEPRVTFSWINHFDFTTGKHSNMGFGLELEMAPPAFMNDENTQVHVEDDEEYPEHTSVPNREAPKNRIRIPKQNVPTGKVSGFGKRD